MVEDLEDGDEAAAHGEAEDTADVGNEPDDRNFLEKRFFHDEFHDDLRWRSGRVFATVHILHNLQIVPIS